MFTAHSSISDDGSGRGRHSCFLYETEEEHRTIITAFLQEGLVRNEKVFYLGNIQSANMIAGYLRDEGLEVSSYLSSGRLSILASEMVYVENEAFNPERMISRFQDEVRAALAQGFAGLRVTGEMTWALQKFPGSERLIEYESKVNSLFDDKVCTAICQYDRRRFSPALLLYALATHPLAIIGTKTYRNLYHWFPPAFIGQEPASRILAHWLDDLVRHNRGKRGIGKKLYAKPT